MQLEELQKQWQRLDRKLDRSLAFQAELVRKVVMQPARRRVNRLTLWPAIDVAFSIFVLLFVGMQLSDHFRDGRLAAPAGIIMIGVIALLTDSICQLQRVAKIDWCGPVARIQESLEQLRVAKIRQFKWIMLTAPLMGFSGMVVGLHWLFRWLSHERVNILDELDPWWIVVNYAFGALFVPVGFVAARLLAQRCHGQNWWQGVLDGISGTSLKAAAVDVERWMKLQQE